MSEVCEENRIDPTVEQFLRICSQHYESLIERTNQLRRHGSPEAVLTWIEMVAGFAAMHHPGRFADGGIENAALELGCDIPRTLARGCQPISSTDAVPQKMSRRRVLHVATTILAIGGHTRTILNWIRKDFDSQHSLVLTHQAEAPIPSALPEAVAASGGQFVSVPDSAALIERARWLRRFAEEKADFVILHLNPNDIVPVVAFAHGTRLPVALVNVADQCFWVGSSVSDMIINLREISITTNRELRYTRNDRLLPIPLFEARRALERCSARKELGIPASHKMLLTVGRSIKYAPSRRQNFLQTTQKILDRNPEAHLYLVGVKEEDHVGAAGYVRHGRMHFVGPINDATVYQRASDVYLEGFPFGSQTALLESVLPGVPCVRVFAPPTPLLAAHDIALTGIADNPTDEEDYIRRAGEFIMNADQRQRIGEVLRERVLYYHVCESWNQYLEEIYRTLEQLSHTPFEIPCTGSSCRLVDLAISEYHGSKFVGGNLPVILDGVIRSGIMYAAYSLRQRGFHADSFRFVRMANYRRWWDLNSVRFAAKLLPHRVVYTMSSQ